MVMSSEAVEERSDEDIHSLVYIYLLLARSSRLAAPYLLLLCTPPRNTSRPVPTVGSRNIISRQSTTPPTLKTGLHPLPNTESATSPVARLTFGWYIGAFALILGGLKGYRLGTSRTNSNVPPLYAPWRTFMVTSSA